MDNQQVILDFLKDKLSQSDLAQLAKIMRIRVPDGLEGYRRADARQAMADQIDVAQAKRETAPVLGPAANDMALDTAAKVYRRALRSMGVSVPDHLFHAPSLQSLYLVTRDRRRQTGAPLLATDSRAADDFASRHPNAASIEVI